MSWVAQKMEKNIRALLECLFPKVNVVPGDLIAIDRNIYYQHWAVYIGDGDVVHLTTENDVLGACLSSLIPFTTDAVVVKKEPFWEVVGNNNYRISNKYDERYSRLPVHEIISRAKESVGKMMMYNLLTQNCEHFATSLCYDTSVSDQVDSLQSLTFLNLLQFLFGYQYISTLEKKLEYE